MDAAAADLLVTTVVAIFLFLALCAALALVTVSVRRPRGTALLVASGIVVLCLVLVAVLPWHVPALYGAVLALLAVALATFGGNPVARWVLTVADGGRSAEGLAAALGIVAGFPAVIAVLVALKGIGRFTELATPAARERFIVGTLASLLWACAVSAIVPLALR